MSETRAALVTGASARIGLAIATRLADAGYAVALHASPRSGGRAHEQARCFRERGVASCALAADLADADSCGKLVADAVSELGPLTLLVNNAAVFEPDSAVEIDLALWDLQFAVNLRAPAILSAAFAAQAQAKDDPSIVNLIDQRVLRPTPHYFSYTLAKSALWTATQTMAQTFAARGVRVNAVGPGPVLPSVHEGRAGFSSEIESVPLRHAVDPDDVADCVLYLAGARSVTGQIIAVDAGQHLGWRDERPR